MTGGAAPRRQPCARRAAPSASPVGVSALGPCVLAGGRRRTAAAARDPVRHRLAGRRSGRAADREARRRRDPRPLRLAALEPVRRTQAPLACRRGAAVWSATRRVFGASSYLAARLTGEYVLDHHSASHWAPLYDVHAQRLDRRVGAVVAPGLALPRLVWPHEECGAVSREAAAATGSPEGTPVAAGSIDSWARWPPRGCAVPARACSSTAPACSSSRSTARRARPQAVEHRRLHARLAQRRRRGRLGRGAHGLAARPDRRRALRDAVRRGRRGGTRGRRPPRAALLRRRAHAAVRPRPARRGPRPDGGARTGPPLPCAHGGRRVRRAPQPRDDARGRRHHRRACAAAAAARGRPVAADRERRHRAGAGRARGSRPAGVGAALLAAIGRRRGDAADRRGLSRRSAWSPTRRPRSCTTSCTGGSASSRSPRAP